MTTTLTRRIAAGAIAIGATVTVGVVGAGDAQAAGHKVCHLGTALQPPVEVHESGGAEYAVYPGTCSPNDPGIIAWRPLAGTRAIYRYGGEDPSTNRKADYRVGQWNSVLRDVYVKGVSYGF